MNWTDEMVEKAIHELLGNGFTTDGALEQIKLYIDEETVDPKARDILEEIEKEHS